MISSEELGIKVYADGADLENIIRLYENPLISGFTTNPTLMRAAGVTDYEGFAKTVLAKIHDRPISFEVFADEFEEMEEQANRIASWGSNVFVKIPICNTKGESAISSINRLSGAGVKLNVTAIFTMKQVQEVVDAVARETEAVVSVFAGRVADTGIDPIPMMSNAVDICSSKPLTELLWASPREVLNVYQAAEIGCDIITITPDLIKKLEVFGKSLEEYSLETVKMFYEDAKSSKYQINI